MTKVSIIIPVYNVEKYLNECLDSVVNQTLKNIEIIIINDGSTDKSLEIINQYLTIDKRIKLLQTQHQGPGSARNKGIKIAKSEYIAFIDSDDFIEETMLEDMYNIAIKDKSEIVKCRYSRVNENSSKTNTVSKLINNSSHNDLLKSIISLEHINVVWNNLYLAKLLKKNYFPNIYYEDVALIFKLYFFAKKINYTNNILYNWRLRDGSITRSISQKHIDDIFEVLDITYNFLKEKDIYKKYQTEFTQRCVIYLIQLIENVHRFGNDNKDNLIARINEKKSSRKYWSEKKLEILKRNDSGLYLRYIQNAIEYSDCNILDKKALCFKLYESQINLLKKEMELNTLLSYLQYNQKKLKTTSLKRLKNKFKGKYCFILGEGPSFAEIDKSKLTSAYSFGTSSILNKFKPDFYVSTDQHIIEKDSTLIEQSNIKYKFIPFHYNNLIKIKKPIYPLRIDHGYKQRLHSSYQIPRFSKKIDKKIFCGETDIHLCMQLAYYMGFSTIYLIGIDLSYTENKLTLYRDTTEKGLSRIFSEFKLAKKIFEKDNRKIINLSHQSALKMFKTDIFKPRK